MNAPLPVRIVDRLAARILKGVFVVGDLIAGKR